MRVAEAVDRNAAAEVEIFVAFVVPGVPVLAVRDGEAPVGERDDVLIVEGLDLRARGRLRL
jgi:hypothetical protein